MHNCYVKLKFIELGIQRFKQLENWSSNELLKLTAQTSFCIASFDSGTMSTGTRTRQVAP